MKWEYKTITIDSFVSDYPEQTVESKLNALGQEGWEMTGVMDKQQYCLGPSGMLDEPVVVLKRAIK